jgi:hypothetical protein
MFVRDLIEFSLVWSVWMKTTYFGCISWTCAVCGVVALGGTSKLLLSGADVFLFVVDIVDLTFIFFCRSAAG